MQNFIKFAICLLVAMLLSGCGFQPLYQDNGARKGVSNPQQFKINIKGDPANAELHYKMRRELELWLTMVPQKVSHPLHVTLTIESAFGDVALNSKAKVLRSQGHLQVSIQVFDLYAPKNEYPILNTKLESITSYTVQEVEEFSIMFAEKGANDRMITDLARRISHALANLDYI